MQIAPMLNSFPFRNNLSVKHKSKDAAVLQAEANAGQMPTGIDVFLLLSLSCNRIEPVLISQSYSRSNYV